MLRENVALASLTTLRVGGPARYVYEVQTIADMEAACTLARACGLPLYPLGQGSNVLASDAPIEAVVVHLVNTNIEWNGNEVIADAGYEWDQLVREAAARGLWGIENLAAIPGTVGAAPVQNIGAYGAEVADTLVWVECYDTNTNTLLRIQNEACAFGYRESRFKQEQNLIIVRVALHLSTEPKPNVSYTDLQRIETPLTTPQQIGDAVRAIRARKFPDLSVFGTAGSFFKNPTISAEMYKALQAKYPAIPGFETALGIKVPLAWILDHVLDLRGYRMGNVHLFENQPLVLVTESGATAAAINALAEHIAQKVFDATEIKIEREVRSLA